MIAAASPGSSDSDTSDNTVSGPRGVGYGLEKLVTSSTVLLKNLDTKTRKHEKDTLSHLSPRKHENTKKILEPRKHENTKQIVEPRRREDTKKTRQPQRRENTKKKT